MLLVLLLCCIWAWYSWRKCRLERLTGQVGTMPGALPFVGHAYKFLGSTEDLWNYFREAQTESMKRGGIVKLWIGPFLFFVVTDPNIAQIVLSTFEDKIYLYDFGKTWGGLGLVTADVTTWRRHRKLLNPTFNQHLLDGFITVFNEISDELAKNLENEVGKGESNVVPYLEKSFLKNICQTSLGLSSMETIQICNKEFLENASKMFYILCRRFQNIFMHPMFIYKWTETRREEEKAVKFLKGKSFDVINMKKSEFNDGDDKKSGCSLKGFLDCLLELQSRGLLSDSEVADEVDTIIMAGSDTLATAMIFILNLLAYHPDVQDRVYNEIINVMDKPTGYVDKGHLSKFIYMEAVIKEALRIYPIVPLIARKVIRDYKQDDLVLPSGSGVIVIFSGVHRSDCWGKDAEMFKPERWLDGSLPDNPAAFCSFSLGRRGCIGRIFAMMSMKTTLVYLIRRYRLSKKEMKLRLKWETMLKPLAGHHISIELRK